MARSRLKVEEVVPAAARTIKSLRDIGYELPQAVADLVDNSIEAHANEVHIDLCFDGPDSWIRIADNGDGMDTSTITESLRIGSVREYEENDLGKFGFGLKTASISQCRRVVVASRVSPHRARVEARAFDLGHIEETNRWEILVIDPVDRPGHLTDPLKTTTGTVVLWEDLDRVLTYQDPYGGWARRRLLEQAEAIAEHLGMVFHRFITGQVRGKKTKLFVNGSIVEAWDPFCLDQAETAALEENDYRVAAETGLGIVHLRPYVLPDKADFSDTAAWNRASGPRKWNNQQGLYIYRANRLIQWGGWSRLRTNDEHTKLARVALDFSRNLDSAFGLNISKASVKLPPDLREEIEPAIKLVASAADARYRKGKSKSGGGTSGPASTSKSSAGGAAASRTKGGASTTGAGYGLPPLGVKPRQALESAARSVNEQEALERIMATVKRTSPEVARGLGW